MPGFVTELKRRNVFRVGVAYVVVAWVIAQVFDLAVDSFGAPDWVMKIILAILIAGLPFALIFAWAFELTPEGVKRTAEVPVTQSITPRTGRKLNVITTTALVLALAFIAWDKLGDDDSDAPTSAITDKSVAVLPFTDMSENQDQEWFADGLTEEILNALARLPELQVTARTSSFEFKNTNKDIRDFAKQLGVAHVVEGSVRRIGVELRVTAQLIRASDGFHLWSNTYNRTTEDLFNVQDDVAENIAATLDVILDDEKRTGMVRTGTRDVAAFEAFLKGRDLYSQAHDRNATEFVSLADANVYLERAMELDPNFGPPALLHADRFAHRLLEGNALIIGGEELDEEAAYTQLRRDFDIAVNNAANPSARLIAEIDREFFGPHWHRLPALIEQIREMAASKSAMHPARSGLLEILLFMREFDLAEELLLQQQEIDPLNRDSLNYRTDIKICRGEFEAAAKLVDEASRISGITDSLRERQVVVSLLSGDKSAAIEQLETDFEFSGDYYYMEPLLAALKGDRELALQLAAKIESRSVVPDQGLIWTYVELGDQERLCDLVSRIDALRLGSVALALEVATNGAVFPFDLDDAPNLKRRLDEAGLDPSDYQESL